MSMHNGDSLPDVNISEDGEVVKDGGQDVLVVDGGEGEVVNLRGWG